MFCSENSQKYRILLYGKTHCWILRDQDVPTAIYRIDQS
jgi:hypothetical protein